MLVHFDNKESFVIRLRSAANKCSDEHRRNALTNAAIEVDIGIAALLATGSGESMARLNSVWARASRILEGANIEAA